MMKVLGVAMPLFVLALLGATPGGASTQAPAATATAAAGKLPHLPLDQALAHLRTGTIDFDVAALREDYAAKPGFKALPWMDRAIIIQAVNAGKAEEVVKRTTDWLGTNPLEWEAYLARSWGERTLGNVSAADQDRRIGTALFQALDGSGDGMTPATAWHVISVTEEYALLAMKALQPGSQELINRDGHVFDRLDVTDTSGVASKRWFNIDRVIGHEF